MDSGKNIFPSDTISRAKELYSEIGSIGAYSQSQGVPFIRKNVADFIERMCDWTRVSEIPVDTIYRT
jgi:alanine transaminase